jgi:uncharacterized RDD family membrane protein YckC
MNSNSNALGYASFGRRFMACLVDVIFLNLITIPLLLAFYGAEALTSPDGGGGFGSFFITWLLPAIVTIVFWLMLAATPGKLLAGIKVVHAVTGERLTFAQAVIRYLGYIVSLVPLGLGYFWMLKNPRKQTWHDLLAKSVVIRRGPPVPE